jgi:hypothetical protein
VNNKPDNLKLRLSALLSAFPHPRRDVLARLIMSLSLAMKDGLMGGGLAVVTGGGPSLEFHFRKGPSNKAGNPLPAPDLILGRSKIAVSGVPQLLQDMPGGAILPSQAPRMPDAPSQTSTSAALAAGTWLIIIRSSVDSNAAQHCRQESRLQGREADER